MSLMSHYILTPHAALSFGPDPCGRHRRLSQGDHGSPGVHARSASQSEFGGPEDDMATLDDDTLADEPAARLMAALCRPDGASLSWIVAPCDCIVSVMYLGVIALPTGGVGWYGRSTHMAGMHVCQHQRWTGDGRRAHDGSNAHLLWTARWSAKSAWGCPTAVRALDRQHV